MLFSKIDPVAFSLFGFPIRWYGIAYMVSFYLCWSLACHYHKFDVRRWGKTYAIDLFHFDNLISYCVVGVIVGGRLGHVLFYGGEYYMQNPLAILKVWEGGMAFHGGFLGCTLGAYIYLKKNHLNVRQVADLMALVVPIGIGLVRIANFINQELPGTPTSLPIGIIFSCDSLPRHPSQLYEAFLEGFGLFFLLRMYFLSSWYVPKTYGRLCGFFLVGYGLARFCVEYVREPLDGVFQFADVILTYGQVLSLPMVFAGLFFVVKYSPWLMLQSKR